MLNNHSIPAANTKTGPPFCLTALPGGDTTNLLLLTFSMKLFWLILSVIVANPLKDLRAISLKGSFGRSEYERSMSISLGPSLFPLPYLEGS